MRGKDFPGQSGRSHKLYGEGADWLLSQMEKRGLSKTAASQTIGKGRNGYIAFYKRKRVEVYADTSLEAREIAAKHFRARRPYDVEVVLAEQAGKPVTHMPLFASTGLNCEIIKANDGRWYLGLEDDWSRGEMHWHGPFSSMEQADRYLSKNFANPGGFMVDESGTEDPPSRPLRPRRPLRPSRPLRPRRRYARQGFDYEGSDFGFVKGSGIRPLTLYYPLENIGRRGRKVNAVQVAFVNMGASRIAWDYELSDRLRMARNARQALLAIEDVTRAADNNGDEALVDHFEFKGVDRGIPTPKSQVIEDIEGRHVQVSMNTKPIRVSDPASARELERGFQRLHFEIPHRFKKKVHSLRDEIKNARSYREVSDILSKHGIRHDINILMDPMYQ